MVRIPFPQEPLRIPGSSGLSAPASAPPPGGARSAQIEQLGQVMQQTGSRLFVASRAAEERLHVAAVKEAQALAEERIIDADIAYRARLGKAAVGQAREQAVADLQKQLSTIEDGLEHGVQRRLFRDVATRRMLDVREVWGRHESRQLQAYEFGASEAVLQAKITAARRQGPAEPRAAAQEPRQGAILPTAPGLGNEGEVLPQTAPGLGADADRALTVRAPANRSPDLLRSVRAEASNLAARAGYGPEQTDAFVRAKLSEVHVGIVEDLVSAGRGSAARDYLGGIPEGDLEPEARRKLGDLVRRFTLQDESLTRALDVIDRGDRQAGETGGTFRDGMVASFDLEAFAMADLDRQFRAGKIDAQERDLALDRVMQTASLRRRQRAEQENRALDEAEQWALENRALGIADMPPKLYQDLAAAGKLPEIASFIRSGRHTTDPEALYRFMRIPTSVLRQMDADVLRADLRTRMDNDTLDWAMRVHANARAPGSDADSAIIKRIVEQKFLELGREKSPLELRRGFVASDMKGYFLTDLDTAPTAVQRERMNKFWIRFQELKDNLRQSGVDITPETVNQIADQILIDEAVNVDQSFFFGDLRGIPISTMTDEQLANAYGIIDGERIPLSAVPGRSKVIPGLGADVFGTGDVRAEILEMMRREGETWSPQTVLEVWDRMGRPKNIAEFQAAVSAAAQFEDSSIDVRRSEIEAAVHRVRSGPLPARQGTEESVRPQGPPTPFNILQLTDPDQLERTRR